MNLLKVISVLIISLILSGCVGIGIEYNTYEDIQFNLKKYPGLHDESVNKLMEKTPYKIYEKDGDKIYVFNYRKIKPNSNNYIFLLFPIPLPKMDVEKQTELYFKNNQAYKLIYRNSTSHSKGFGFVCAPPFWGGSICNTLP
ncbi:hypothetical protein [Colwellia sp. TT2012]|uniref:hypothetical protein n=1 Tax=Colwellia sp. TT2012 TaxID=1720342 RepID=UPI0007101943|nr:hypothetical protein [Colwellia sp. TT2012]